MSPRSQRKKAPAPVSTKERVKSLEDAVMYLSRKLQVPEISPPDHRMAVNSAPTPRLPSTRDSLDEILAKMSRLNGHLDALSSYMFGGAPGGGQVTGEAPMPSAASDKILLIDSRLSYALASTEEFLNRF